MAKHPKPRFQPRSEGRKPDRMTTRPPQAGKPGFRPTETFEATFLGHPEGVGGFLRPAGMDKAARMDLLVDWREAHGAIHGDKVLAEVSGETFDGRLRARILNVLSRSTEPLPALLQKQAVGGSLLWRAIPVEPRLSQLVSVAPTDLAGDGDYVSVLLDPDPEAKQLRGTVLAKLGRPTDLKIENKLTAALYNLRTTFPDAVMKELAPFPTAIPEEWVKGREDLRDLVIVTVDPPTAKDFDDAISLEVLPEEEGGGWILGVHIADVSHYVPENGPLDVEARLRGTSVYFPDEAIPMIPERLSGDLCSLREGVDRLTMSAWMTVSPGLEVVEARFTESVIKSRKRLTYDEVKEACLDLSTRKRAELGDEACGLLDQCLVLSRQLTQKRLGRGALNLETEETEFVFEEGRPVDARKYTHHEAHTMIEEFMLLANEAVARFFSRKKIPAIYRVHDTPDPLKLEVFKEIAGTFGLMRPYDNPTPEVLNALLKKISGGPLEVMLNTLLLRSLKKAEYSADNIGHSGLALQDYLHFTSPIRRYPDLVTHRYLRKVLKGEPLPEGLHGHLAIIAKQASDAEQKATEAERENDRWKTCLLMKPKIGQKFDGRIQGYSLKVMFVRLESPFVEVGVPLAALGGNFVVDEHKSKATGMRGQAVLSIGDAVKVEIVGVDEDLRRVSAWVTEATARDDKGKPMRFTPALAAPATLREADFVPERRVSKHERGVSPRGGRAEGREERRGGFKSRDEKPRKPKGSVRGPSAGPARPKRGAEASRPKPPGRKKRS
ncbi:MAG: VacB/RNase II family 3'-5' exoribonuclease [Holophagaceae bacterium]